MGGGGSDVPAPVCLPLAQITQQVRAVRGTGQQPGAAHLLRAKWACAFVWVVVAKGNRAGVCVCVRVCVNA